MRSNYRDTNSKASKKVLRALEAAGPCKAEDLCAAVERSKVTVCDVLRLLVLSGLAGTAGRTISAKGTWTAAKVWITPAGVAHLKTDAPACRSRAGHDRKYQFTIDTLKATLRLHGAMTVPNLVDWSGISEGSVRRYLIDMLASGSITAQRRGKATIYTLAEGL